MANENEEKRGTLGKQAKKNRIRKIESTYICQPRQYSLPSLTSIVIIAPLAIVKKMKLVHIFQERVFGFMVADRKRSGGTKKERESGADIVEDGMVTECFKQVSRFQVEQNLWLCFSGRELTRAWESRSKLVSNLRRFLIFYPDFASVLCKLVTC